MSDKRISQLVERVTIANNDVLPIVALNAATTNKVTISTIQDWMQTHMDLGVTSISVNTSTSGSDISISGSPITSTGTITINIPTASATKRGALSSADWSTFNGKQDVLTFYSPLQKNGVSVTIDQADTDTNGYLSYTDWNTFNNKEGALTKGNLTETISGVLTITGGTAAVIGTGTTIEVKQASGSQDGFLDSSDWTTFNNKVSTSRSISTTAPLQGGGDLSANRTLSITQSGSASNGYLSSTDWNTFNNKQNALSGTGVVKSTAGTISYINGLATQYIDGTGSLQTFPSIIGTANNLTREVYNETGATLVKGTVIYINGGHGNLPTITKALATGDSTSAQTYGVVQNDISDQSNGYIVVIGDLFDMPTSGYLEGTQLYLSSTTAGEFTSTKQYAPAHLVYVGIVTRSHPTQGVIAIKIQNGYEMDELHDVSARNPDNNDILQFKTATGLWTKVAGSTTNIAEGTNLYYTDARSRGAFSESVTGLDYNSTTGVLSTTAGYGIPTTASQSNWDAAYNDKINSAAVTGTTTKTLTLTQQDGGTITASWTDINTDAVSSVFGRTGAVVAVSGDYTTAQVTESGNLYFTNGRARSAISLTTTGSSGAATYTEATGVFNIPSYTLSGLGGEPTITAGTTAQYWRGDKSWQTLNTANVPELTNLYFTDARARAAITLTTTGTSGAATYTAGVLNIPQYQAALTNPVTGTGTTNFLPKFTGASAIGDSIVSNTGTFSEIITISKDGNYGTRIDIKNGTDGTAAQSYLSLQSTTGRFLNFGKVSPLFTSTTWLDGNDGYIYNGIGNLSIFNESGNIKFRSNNVTSSYFMVTSSVPVSVGNGTTIGGRYEFYKDGTPTKAGSIGNGISGGSASDDVIIGTYNTTTSWISRVTIANSNGAVSLLNLAGTGTRMVVTDANGLLSTQAIPTGSITGSGTTNYVTKWTSGSALGNSLIYDNGTFVGVNTDTASTSLTGAVLTLRASSTNEGQTAISIQGYDKKPRWAINGQDAADTYNLSFYQGNGLGSYTRMMTLGANQNVTIGNIAPGSVEKLEVNGRVKFNGLQQDAIQTIATIYGYNAAGQDKALYFKLTAGTPLWTMTTGAVGTDAGINIMPNGSNGLSVLYDGKSIFNNNVGINNVAPLSPLAFANTTGNKIDFYNDNAGNRYSAQINSGELRFYTGTGTTDSITLYAGNVIGLVNTNGKIGIGTASPSSPLTVSGQTDLAWVDAVTTLRIARSGSVARIQNYDGGAAGNIAMCWDGGNLGVGTGAPTTLIHAKSSLPRVAVDTTSQYAVFNMYVNGAEKGAVYWDNTDDVLRIQASNTALCYGGTSTNYAVYAKSNGRIGMGTITPISKVEVRYDGNNGGGDYAGYNILATTDSTSQSYQATIGAMHQGAGYANLNLGSKDIGSGVNVFWHISKRLSTDGHRLEYYYYNGSGFSSKFYFTTAGDFWAAGDVTAFSDISVKRNIRPIENVIDRINKSRGVLYDRTDINTNDNIGFIAQELEVNFPELISVNTDGTKGVKYQNAVAVLFEAVKEQQKQIDKLKKQVA